MPPLQGGPNENLVIAAHLQFGSPELLASFFLKQSSLEI
jgi:hypothetical protein